MELVLVVHPGVRLYVDIDRLIRNCNINWNTIIQCSKEDKSELRIAIVFYLSYQLLKTPIPEKYMLMF